MKVQTGIAMDHFWHVREDDPKPVRLELKSFKLGGRNGKGARNLTCLIGRRWRG